MIWTNINKTRSEIIYELVLSLNKGDSYYALNGNNGDPRIKLAIAQYDALVRCGVLEERGTDD